MATPLDFGNAEYRVVLVDPASRRLLVLQDDGSSRLLRVSVAKGTRVAWQLQSILEREWNLRTVVVDFVSLEKENSHCAVAELLTLNFPSCLRTVSLEDIAHTELSDRERTDISAILRDAVDHPVSRVGWIEEALAWFRDVTGITGFSKHSVEQFNAGRGFSLLRFRTETSRNFWLKATWFPNAHELGLTKLLSNVCPNSLPTWIAEKPEWNAWLMLDEPSAETTLPTKPQEFAQFLGLAVRSLAELQLQTVGMETSLCAAGAFDQRVGALRADADLLFSYMTRAMQHQTSTKVARMESDRLTDLQQVFREACNSIDGVKVPSTIVHGDMNLGNLLLVSGGCRFIDWSEGYVGHPFVTLQHILLLNRIESPGQKASVNRELTGIYCNAMRDRLTSRQVQESLAWMPLLAAGSALYGRGEWLRNDEGNDSRRFGFARTVARHMDIAVRELTASSAYAN